jgi:hypothetical protein
MRVLLALIGICALALVVAIGFGLVSVKQTKTAMLPEFALTGGQAPAFKADVANVSIGTENQTVSVPTVGMTQQNIAVPTVKVTKPGDANKPQPAPATN